MSELSRIDADIRAQIARLRAELDAAITSDRTRIERAIQGLEQLLARRAKGKA